MTDNPARLIHEFTYRASVSAPNEIGVGPFGQRQYYELNDGTLEGPRMKGRQLGSATDWMLIGADGFMRMNVRVQIATEDGAIICARYSGPAEANGKLTEALAACTPTLFSDHSIRTHWLLETGDPRYAWINQTVFVGGGRLCPAGGDKIGFEHRVYRLG